MYCNAEKSANSDSSEAHGNADAVSYWHSTKTGLPVNLAMAHGCDNSRLGLQYYYYYYYYY